ncbi:MAG: hypothetical protein AMXMBFR13_25130 [Phycisphaerae bacterium]
MSLLCGLIAFVPGCADDDYFYGAPRLPTFSPDGSVFAYVRQPSYHGKGDPIQRLDVCWRNVSRPEVEHVATTQTKIATFHDRATLDMIVRFAPDSQHLAVATPLNLEVVDLRTAELRRVSEPLELVTSCAWLDEQTVVYAAHTSRSGQVPETSQRTFYAHRIDQASSQRRVLFREEAVQAGTDLFDWPLERWSPDGQHVIFMNPYEHGRFRLLQVASGRVRDVGPCDGYTSSVAWKPDSSAAACVAGRWPVQAWMVEPGTGQIRDFSVPFRAAFGDYPPRIGPLWTADNQYLLVHTDRLGGCLVRPVPWQVIDVRLLLQQHLDPADRPHDARTARRWPTWALQTVPVPGWIACWAPAASLWIINYDATLRVDLGPRWISFNEWSISPDGRWFLQSGSSYEDSTYRQPVNPLRRLDLPSSQAAPASKEGGR